jgi:hypothetical protein
LDRKTILLLTGPNFRRTPLLTVSNFKISKKFIPFKYRPENYVLNGVMTSGWCIHPGGPQGYYLDCSVFLLASTWIQAAAQFPTRYTDA